MTITANTFNLVALPTAGKEWQVSLQTENASGVEPIKAAESGYTHFLTYLHIRTDTGTDMDIGSGETVEGTIDDVYIGTVPMDAASGFFLWKAPKGMGLKFTLNQAIVIDATAGTIWIEAHGLTTQNQFER